MLPEQLSPLCDYAETGRNGDAIVALQKCLDEREERMLWIANEPRFENLRDDPRFQILLQRMRLV